MRTVLARWSAAIAVVLAAMPTSAQTPSTDPQPLTIDGATSYVYKTVDKYELRLHAFKPDPPSSGSKAAAIVFFFGGGFRNGSVRQFVPQGTYFAHRGMVAIVADYRVFSRHGTTPLEAIADAKSAVRWVRAHSSQLGIDPNRIAASGGSSGGLLALTAAVLDDFDEAGEDKTVSSKPNALVLFSTGVGTRPTAPPGTSPMQHLRGGLPPTLILHGKADATVPYADVERFCAESKALGNDCQMVGYEGAPHGFFNPARFDGKWYRETLLEADRFLTRLGYVTAAPKHTPVDHPVALIAPRRHTIVCAILVCLIPPHSGYDTRGSSGAHIVKTLQRESLSGNGRLHSCKSDESRTLRRPARPPACDHG